MRHSSSIEDPLAVIQSRSTEHRNSIPWITLWWLLNANRLITPYHSHASSWDVASHRARMPPQGQAQGAASPGTQEGCIWNSAEKGCRMCMMWYDECQFNLTRVEGITLGGITLGGSGLRNETSWVNKDASGKEQNDETMSVKNETVWRATLMKKASRFAKSLCGLIYLNVLSLSTYQTSYHYFGRLHWM